MSGAPLPPPRLRDDFRKRLRAELMNEAVALAEERRLSSRTFARRLRWWIAGPRLRAAAVVATLVVMLGAGAGAAAAGSLPGDPGYGLKRAAEQVQLALAPTPEARVQVLATQAQRRLDELTRTADEPAKAPTASAEYEAAVQRFAAAVEALRSAEPGAKHEAVDQVVNDARDKDVPVLEDLKDRLPADAQQGIDRAIDAQEKLAPSSDDRRPSARPTRTPERERATEAPRETERPRATTTSRPRESEGPRPTETPRGDQPSESPGD
ncbi:MAG: hypothetical protein KGN00_12615 [Chloroflexota bacterium]|nr:hypothetical protein [Chloroflexota bacterium]MDE3194515.1 hypothetical protein [Chloroflexota bacterium]